MRIEELRYDRVSVIKIIGELDAGNLPDAGEVVDGNFKGLRSRLVFNVEDIPIVTSTAISFFIDTAKRAREFDGDAVLFSTEESALRFVGGHLRAAVDPGQMIVVDRGGAQAVRPFGRADASGSR